MTNSAASHPASSHQSSPATAVTFSSLEDRPRLPAKRTPLDSSNVTKLDTSYDYYSRNNNNVDINTTNNTHINTTTTTNNNTHINNHNTNNNNNYNNYNNNNYNNTNNNNTNNNTNTTTTTNNTHINNHNNTTTTTSPNTTAGATAPDTSYRPKHARNLSTASITSASSLRNALPQLDTPTKLARNVSPGLLARMKFLNQQTTDAANKSVDVGRIEDDKIRKLDEFHRDRSWSVDRRGAAWNGLHAQPESAAVAVAEPVAGEGLQEGVGRLDRSKVTRSRQVSRDSDAELKGAPSVGRIDADKLRRLDESHRHRSLTIERRGTAWSGGGKKGKEQQETRQEQQETRQEQQETRQEQREEQEQEDASSIPPSEPGKSDSTPLPSLPSPASSSSPPPSTATMEPDFASDHSSVVSTSDKVLPSESEADEAMDMQKYRLPDITKPKTLNTPVPPAETNTTNTTDTPPSRAPTPPPKDTPPIPPAEEASVLDDHNGIDIASYFEKRQLHRANSIYTLSKASFTNQIQQLTSMKLPPTTIASEITALASSTLAGRALHKAAHDIMLWIAKTKEVLHGLDAEDDVEWAAAAGREGLAEVDAAIGKFEGLVTVYITAIEDLQARPDIAALPSKDQATLVSQMEDIVSNWSEIKQTLKGIKNQVEIAMEWEELWNNVLGEIGFEVENLSRLVFEMEERRHRVISDSIAEAPEKFDIAELETIVEETPRKARMMNNRFSMPLPPTLSVQSPISPIPQIEQENSRLLALFAKLQPLRASLDFLPMRLTAFQMRASSLFPSACDELNRRKEQLEEQEKKLEAEADALREELGEDKWVHSFRQAGSKAVAMYESCMKSIDRLTQAIQDNDEEKLPARIATYKDKKSHYPPSMRRVLELIDIEMKHRSTVNGEILRIQQDVRSKVTDLENVTKDMDAVLADFTASRKLRDSVSTVLSARTEASSARETPNSSPASSVVLSRKSSDYSNLRLSSQKPRQSSFATPRSSLAPDNRRYSSINLGPSGPSYSVPKAPLNRLDLTPSRAGSSTPTRHSRIPQTERPAVKPRWSSDVKVRDSPSAINLKPLATPTTSMQRAGTPDRLLRSVSGQSGIPVKSPLGKSAPSPQSGSSCRLSAGRPSASPVTPAGKGKTPMSVKRQSLAVGVGSRMTHEDGEETDKKEQGAESPAARRTARPMSVMDRRRTSLLPTLKQRSPSAAAVAKTKTTPERGTGSASRMGKSVGEGRASAASGRMSSAGERPKWK
ncbi:hypothetical protein LEMA_P122600.1 [Plenodomus lingam JN3]|uniref:KAR9-domain-containing protein n=1 Tax=Leptosphaeria maculans (strain JN3 / isolate v23.1.3 / race Av1-4-5-6-7-8) TaxID=985895 RepID=E4ZSA1_LEPMJ|nr:hypothetical protein LEMA_P122600.1 [Plenodomus lingam JN3]CBX94281.1 hypothetical protein LEMA_P122600.1 [Plenodomus lingam JN3]